MFTIKIIQEDGHHIVKSEVKSVMFNPPTELCQASLFVWYKDEPAETIDRGRVYLMNENGKTVSDYEIYRIPSLDIATLQ